MKKPLLIIMCGLPASGKNTWIKKHSKTYTVVELDWIRKEIFGHQFHINAEPFIIGMAKSFARMLLSQGKNVIINATNLTHQIRMDWIRIGNEYNANTTIVWKDETLTTSLSRNAERIDDKVPETAILSMFKTFEPPYEYLGRYDIDKVKILRI